MPGEISRLLALAGAATLCACVPAEAPPPVAPPPAPVTSTLGGVAIDPAGTIIDNAARSRDHSTLVGAIRTAGLASTLASSGPYTLFAPTNSAFRRLPPTTIETLMHPANRQRLAGLLGYHVVPGRKTRSDIIADIRAGGGTATYRTQAGGLLRARLEGGNVVLTDAYNHRIAVTRPDVVQANGVIHVIDMVLLPTLS